MNRRRYAQLCLACAMAVLATVAAAASPPRIGLVLKSVGNPFFIDMAAGARSYQRQRHADFTLLVDGIASETDVQGQQAIIRRMLARHVSALLIVPADSSALLPLLGRAIAAGVVVVNLDNKLDDRDLARAGLNIPFVGPSNFRGARSVGVALLPALHPGDKAAIIEGPRGSINAKARSDGFADALRSGGIEIAGIRRGDWEEEGGRRSAEQLLAAIPGLRALLCGNDRMAIGAARAVAAHALTGRVRVAGYDGIAAIRPLIANGTVAASADQYPARQAEYALALTLSALTRHTRQADLPAIVQTPVRLMTHTP